MICDVFWSKITGLTDGLDVEVGEDQVSIVLCHRLDIWNIKVLPTLFMILEI